MSAGTTATLVIVLMAGLVAWHVYDATKPGPDPRSRARNFAGAAFFTLLTVQSIAVGLARGVWS